MGWLAKIAAVSFVLVACGGKAIVDGKRVGAGGSGGATASSSAAIGAGGNCQPQLGNCPCTNASQCQTGCYAKPASDGTCSAQGQCLEISQGCWCSFDQNGQTEILCID